MPRIKWEGSSGWLFGEGDPKDWPTEIYVDGEKIILGEGSISFKETECPS